MRALTFELQAPSEANGKLSVRSPKSCAFPLVSTVAKSMTFKLPGFKLPPNIRRRVPVPVFDPVPPPRY